MYEEIYIFPLFAKKSLIVSTVQYVILHGNITYVWGQLDPRKQT